MSSLGRSFRTYSEFVLIDSACPPTINVTVRPGSHEPHAAHERDARGEHRRLDRPMNTTTCGPGWVVRPTFLHSFEEGFGGKRRGRTEAITCTDRDPSKPSTLTAILRPNARSVENSAVPDVSWRVVARFRVVTSVRRTPRARSSPSLRRSRRHRTSRTRADLRDRRHDVRGFVVAAPHRLRREERTVGLDEDAIDVERLRGLTEMLVLRVRDVAREADPVAARRALPVCDEGVAAETVDHDPLRRSFIQYSKDVGPRVADVYHERLAGVVRQCDLRPERPILVLLGRAHPEVVEPALPHPDRSGGRAGAPRSVRPPPCRTRWRRGGACPPWRTHPRWESASSSDRRLVSGSTPTQISRSTPAALRGLDHT